MADLVGELRQLSESVSRTPNTAELIAKAADKIERITEWQPIETALRDGINRAILVTRVPAITRPPIHLVRWSRGPQRSQPRWRIVGFERKPLRYKPTHWAYPLSPPTSLTSEKPDG